MSRLLLMLSQESYRTTDFVGAAQRLGVDLTVATEVPLALADDNPDLYLKIPFDDPAAAAAAARAFAHQWPIDAVVAADDVAVMAADAVASALGLPAHRPGAVKATRDKVALRKALTSAGLAQPWCVDLAMPEELGVVADEIHFPCVVKPTHLSASRGVIRADNSDELARAVRRVWRMLEDDAEARRRLPPGQSPLLVEGYVEGRELAVEGLVREGRFEVLAVFDKPDPLTGPFFPETIYLTPSSESAPTQQAISATLWQAVEAIGLTHGPVHAEVRLRGDEVVVLEVAARTIGGLCSRVLSFGAGTSLEEQVLRAGLGLSRPLTEVADGSRGVMMLPVDEPGVLKAVNGQQEARAVTGIDDVVITHPLDHTCVPLPEGRRYLGFIFARGETAEAVEAALRAAAETLEVVVSSPEKA